MKFWTAFLNLSGETQELSYKELYLLLIRRLSHDRYAQRRMQSHPDTGKTCQTIIMYDLEQSELLLFHMKNNLQLVGAAIDGLSPQEEA